jgi:hypothetical protein
MDRTPMLRKRFSLGVVAAMLCLVGIAREAGATVTFDLIWTATSGAGPGVGTSTITAAVGDTLTLSLRMTTDVAELCFHGVSINFDTDLGNELNLLGFSDWSGTTYGTATMQMVYAPIGNGPTAVESTNAVAGRINTYESGFLTGGLIPLPVGTYTIGTAGFQVNTVSADGPDLWVGLFNGGDGVVAFNGSDFVPVTDLVFNPATLNVPEPGTASLLGLCLVGLGLAVRHSRRS